MGLTLAVLEARVRRNIEETTAGYYDSTDIPHYINQSVRYINRRTLYLVDPTPSTLTLVAGTRQYSLDSACPGPERIVYICGSTGKPIHPISFGTAKNNENLDFYDGTSSEPSYWFKTGKQIAFYPIPASSGTYYYWFLKTPTTMTSGVGAIDSPFSDEMDDLVEWYATWRALMDKDEDNPKTAYYKALFDEGVQQWNDILGVYLAGARKNLNTDGQWMWEARQTGTK